VPRPVSPKPYSFASSTEQHYWHMAQDTAYRAGTILVLEHGSTWLIFGAERQLLVEQASAEFAWFETWRVINDRYRGLSRLWVGGYPIA